MKAIRTQFDSNVFPGAVATPTCSSCCCCCCCAATLTSASAITTGIVATATSRQPMNTTQKVKAIAVAILTPWAPLLLAFILVYLYDSGMLILPDPSWGASVAIGALMIALLGAGYWWVFSMARLTKKKTSAVLATIVTAGFFAVEFRLAIYLLDRKFFSFSGYIATALGLAALVSLILLVPIWKGGKSVIGMLMGDPVENKNVPLQDEGLS